MKTPQSFAIEVQECPINGTYVTRDPLSNCAFSQCPGCAPDVSSSRPAVNLCATFFYIGAHSTFSSSIIGETVSTRNLRDPQPSR